MKTELKFYLDQQRKSPLYYEEKEFPQVQAVNDLKSSMTEEYKVDNKNSTFFDPIYTVSMVGNIILYTPNQGTKRKKYFNHIIYIKGKEPNLAGTKHLFIHFFLHGPCLFHLSTEKLRV